MLMRALPLIIVMICVQPRSLFGDEGRRHKDSPDRPPLIGEVAISDVNHPPPDAKASGLAQVEAWGEHLKKIVIASGKGALPSLGENGSDYLPILYLYCTSQQGPCPFILDSLLEADTITAHNSGGVTCQTMTKFWKNWSMNSFDERSKFLTSLTDGLALAEFNEKSRARYVLCKRTVQSILDDKGALAARYGPEGVAAKSVDLFMEYLKGIRDSKTDIFAVTR